MGGKVAMHVVVAHPDFVERLVVVDIALRALRVGKFSSRDKAEASIAKAIPKPAIRESMLKNLVRHASGGYRWRMNLDVIARNYMELTRAVEAARTFDGPALFVRGVRASNVLDNDLNLIARMSPRYQLVTIPHVGHSIHADAPEKFVAVVCDFLTV